MSGDSRESLSEQVRVRLEKLDRIRKRGENPFRNGFQPTHLASKLHSLGETKSKEQLESEKISVSIAGRIMAIRMFGKAAFIQIQDRSGSIQAYIQKASVGDAKYDEFKEYDFGDIVSVQGYLFRTKTNELTVHADAIDLLTKSLRPLPEKFHGIADVEIRYRQRYLDLMTNEKARETFVIRSKIVSAMRKFFVERDYIEVETPMMHPVVGGATARPFKTHHNTLDMELFLRIAPELYLKRLVVGGMERVFEINRNFRNEGISIQHNPEFTMIEFYQAYATYEDLMDLTEVLFQTLAKEVLGKTTLDYQGEKIVLSGKWPRIPLEEAVGQFSGFKAGKTRDRKALLEYLKSKGHPFTEKMTTAELLMVVFDEEVQPKLIQPTYITHYPLDVSPLSRKNEKDPTLVDRFELFIYGREIANAFSELNDPIDQKARFEAQVQAKAAGNQEACDMDEDYIVALEHGMPPTAGEGIGIDRLTMLFTDSPSIRDVILFPLLRKQSH